MFVLSESGSVGNTLPPMKPIVEYFRVLLAAGANVKASTDSGETALYVAADCGYAECVEALLAAGADVDIQEKDLGRTPLMEAARDGSVECVKLLLKAGANPNIRDNNGSNARDHALQEHHDNVAELLKS